MNKDKEAAQAEQLGLDTEFGKVVKSHSDPALRTALDHWRSQGES